MKTTVSSVCFFRPELLLLALVRQKNCEMACKTSFLAIFVQCRTAVVFSEMTSSTTMVDISFLSWSFPPFLFPLLLPWWSFCVTFFTYFGAPMDSIWLFIASWTLSVSCGMAKVALNFLGIYSVYTELCSSQWSHHGHFHLHLQTHMIWLADAVSTQTDL